MPLKALRSAQVSLTKMSWYYERYQAGMKPSTKASVLGFQYMLLTMLGKHNDAKSVLDDCVLQFNTVLNGDPHMAYLPIIVFLDMIIMLCPERTNLPIWKKRAYNDSMGFFDDFVRFLEWLRHYTE